MKFALTLVRFGFGFCSKGKHKVCPYIGSVWFRFLFEGTYQVRPADANFKNDSLYT